MMGFEQLLMQADIIDSIGVLIGSLAGIISLVVGFYANRIRQQANAQGRQLTDVEKKQVADAEFTQLVAQKVREEMARGKVAGRALYEMATTPEQREIVERDIKPIVDTAGERMKVIEEQTGFFTGQTGVNVNQNTAVPRESDETLEVVNETVRKESEPTE